MPLRMMIGGVIAAAAAVVGVVGCFCCRRQGEGLDVKPPIPAV